MASRRITVAVRIQCVASALQDLSGAFTLASTLRPSHLAAEATTQYGGECREESLAGRPPHAVSQSTGRVAAPTGGGGASTSQLPQVRSHPGCVQAIGGQERRRAINCRTSDQRRGVSLGSRSRYFTGSGGARIRLCASCPLAL